MGWIKVFWQGFGHPTPTLTWLLDGVDITPSRLSDQRDVIPADEGRSRGWSLSRLSLGEEDHEALLSCVAKQPGTEVS